MTSDEWKAAIETIGGQVVDVPSEQVEIVQGLASIWQAAQQQAHQAELTMHTYLQLILPQIDGWEYTFDTVDNRVTLLFRKDKK